MRPSYSECFWENLNGRRDRLGRSLKILALQEESGNIFFEIRCCVILQMAKRRQCSVNSNQDQAEPRCRTFYFIDPGFTVQEEGFRILDSEDNVGIGRILETYKPYLLSDPLQPRGRPPE
jgi:hypothetical protein